MANSPNDYPGQSGTGDSGGLVTEQIRQGTQQVIDQTQQVAGQVKDQVAEQAQSFLESRKGQATGSINQMAEAVRQTGESLRQNNSPVAGVADTVAQRIEGVGQYLEQRDVGQLVSEVERWARRNPALFVGGAFALGVLAARFLKSSTPAPTYPSGSASYTPYGSGYGGYTGQYGNYGGYQGGGYGSPSGYGDMTGYGSDMQDYPHPQGFGSVPESFPTDAATATAAGTGIGTSDTEMEPLGYTEGDTLPEVTDGSSDQSY